MAGACVVGKLGDFVGIREMAYSVAGRDDSGVAEVILMLELVQSGM